MRHYECIYIISPTLEDKAAELSANDVQKLITDQGATINYSENWGKRRMAYEVRKQRYGYYHMIHFEGDNNALTEIDRNLKLNQEVIKFLIVKNDPDKVGKATTFNVEKVKEEV